MLIHLTILIYSYPRMHKLKKYLSTTLSKIKTDRAARSSFINLILKPIGLVLSLVSTPLLLSYLGDTKYGIWATVLSIISWVNYFDVGIGNGLRNVLSKELAIDDFENAKKSVSTAYVILGSIALVLLIISIVLISVSNWNSILSTDENVKPVILISIISIIFSFVLGLSNQILYALQISEVIAIRNIIIQVINIVGIIFLMLFTRGNLIFISLLFGASSLFVYFFNTIQIFNKYKEIKPTISNYEKTKIGVITSLGVKFFIIQLACMAMFTVDNVIISHLFGAEEVTPFNIVYRVFSVLYSFFAAMCIPYWSECTAAIERGNINYVSESAKRLMKICALFVLLYIFFAFFFRPIAYLWLHKELIYQNGLIEVMCLYYCLFSVVQVYTTLINGTGKINFQLILMIISGALNIPLSVFMARDLDMGVLGVRLATTILIAIQAVAYPINLKYELNKLKANLPKIQ